MADTSRPTPGPTSSAPASSTAPAADWPAQVTDTVVGLVDSAKEKVNGPATSGARGIVYGTLIAIIGTAALVLGLVFAFRLLEIGVQALLELADIDKPGRATWISHTLFGLAFLVPGLMALRRGARPAATA